MGFNPKFVLQTIVTFQSQACNLYIILVFLTESLFTSFKSHFFILAKVPPHKKKVSAELFSQSSYEYLRKKWINSFLKKSKSFIWKFLRTISRHNFHVFHIFLVQVSHILQSKQEFHPIRKRFCEKLFSA